jgi:hypothetical protein
MHHNKQSLVGDLGKHVTWCGLSFKATPDGRDIAADGVPVGVTIENGQVECCASCRDAFERHDAQVLAEVRKADSAYRVSLFLR